jgi:hypothetical protein
MKKGILIAIIIIILGLAAYGLITQKSGKRESIEPAPQNSVEAPTQPSPAPATTIDINDNLDQALQDLEQIE